MRKLYRFNWDCGRNGDVEGVFIQDEATILGAMGKTVQFGEILGKHSDVHGVLDAEDLEVLSEDQAFISKLEEVVGGPSISGYNPLDYIDNVNQG